MLAPTLRAHGDAPGDRYDFGALSWRDVSVSVDELLRRRPGRPVVIVGFSYGAAVAVEAAARDDARIDGLVLDSLFGDLRTAVCNRCDLFLPPVLEDLAAWGLSAAAPVVFPEYDAIDPADTCARIDPAIPVLLVRGALDDRITVAKSERIAAAFGGRAESVVFASAAHDRCFESEPARCIATVGAFAQRLIRRH